MSTRSNGCHRPAPIGCGLPARRCRTGIISFRATARLFTMLGSRLAAGLCPKMMSGTLSITLSTENSDLVFSAGGRRRRLIVRRFDHARSMRLSVDPRDGTVRLSLPPRASLAKALRWAEERRSWVEATLAELPKPIRIIPGVALPFNGGTLIVEWRKSWPRAPERIGDRLRLGGPVESVSRRVLSWLRAEAGRVLIAETRA